jgi:hypothetical protein
MSTGSFSSGGGGGGGVANGWSPGCVEHGQRLIIDDNLSAHEQRNKKKGILKRSGSGSFSEQAPLLRKSKSIPSILEVKQYGARSHDKIRTIRFQVVVWYVGSVDVVRGQVPMTFRLSVFWNADLDDDDGLLDEADSVSTRSRTTWSMHGRQQAFEREIKDIPVKAVHVPPVSILNVVTFDTIGAAEVSMLNESTKLMRWTCMYRATLIQENLTVENFPHDRHDINLKLAILAHRGKGRQWDRDVWKLGLATESDSQGSTQVPYGLLVSQVRIPEFQYNRQGVSFRIMPLDHGPTGGSKRVDQCLEVSIPVLRDSGYYDKNIMPILGLLNLVAVSIVCLEPENFFQRGLLTLNIAFVEIGIRMTTDSHLPSVAYQIKMQRMLNEYFCGLLFLVLESIVVYEMYMHFGCSHFQTDVIDWIAAILSLAHNVWTQFFYYRDAAQAKREIKQV